MERQNLKLPEKHRGFLDRFTAACQSDERVLASFLGGSYARGQADAFSDLDLTLITTEAAFESFVAQREVFIRRLGEPLLIEDFNLPDIVFMIFSDGTEAEIHFGSPGHLEHIESGAFHVLLDKTGILEGVEFPASEPDPAEQTETLRRLIYWFWHELSHFVAAIGRGQLWWAQGQVDALRGTCVNLARLRHNFSDAGVGGEPYFKVEEAVPPGDLSALQETFCPIERGAMLRSAQRILEFYKDLAPRLAHAHEVPYPAALERLMTQRLEDLAMLRGQRQPSKSTTKVDK